ncbi:MAG: hypothetical protein AAFY27_00210 [Pseudomonadota bacterium]
MRIENEPWSVPVSYDEKLQIAVCIALAAILFLAIGGQASSAWQIGALVCANAACFAALTLYWFRSLSVTAQGVESTPSKFQSASGDVAAMIIFALCGGYLVAAEVRAFMAGSIG